MGIPPLSLPSALLHPVTRTHVRLGFVNPLIFSLWWGLGQLAVFVGNELCRNVYILGLLNRRDNPHIFL